MLLTRFLASGHRHQHLGLEWAAEGCGYTHTCRRDCEAERPQKTRIRQIHYLRWTDVHWRFVHGMSSSVSGGFCPDSHVRHTERSLFGVARGPSLRFLSFCSPQNSVRNISLGSDRVLSDNEITSSSRICDDRTGTARAMAEVPHLHADILPHLRDYKRPRNRSVPFFVQHNLTFCPRA